MLAPRCTYREQSGCTPRPTVARREVDRASGAERLIGSQHDPQAVDRVGHVGREIAVIFDRIEKQFLLQKAEAVVVGLVGTLDEFIGLGKRAVGRQLAMVQTQPRSLRMIFDTVAGNTPVLHAHDAHAALRTNNIFHEEGNVAHHRPPARLIPADRAVGKRHLQVAIVVHPRLEFFGQPCPNRAHSHGLGLRHQTHHIDIVHAAVNNWRHRSHELLVRLPHGAR